MRITAVDPGPSESAFVVLDFTDKDAVSIALSGKWDNDTILASLHAGYVRNDLTKGKAVYFGRIMAIEMVESFGMPVGKEVFETVWWTGRMCEAWGYAFHRITRKQVKMNLCASMRAKDANIRAALIDRFGPQGTKKDPGPTYGIKSDVWSALAVGATWIDLHVKEEAWQQLANADERPSKEETESARSATGTSTRT